MQDTLISAVLTKWGRGPLAGPVVAGAVILPKDCNISILMIPSNYPKKREKNCMM